MDYVSRILNTSQRRKLKRIQFCIVLIEKQEKSLTHKSICCCFMRPFKLKSIQDIKVKLKLKRKHWIAKYQLCIEKKRKCSGEKQVFIKVREDRLFRSQM